MIRPEHPPVQLRYPLAIRLLSAALIVVPLAAASLVWGGQTPAEEWQAIIPYTALGCWLALTYQVFLVEIFYDARGITYISPVAGMVRYSWSEIVAIFPMRSVDGYMIEADDGRRIWFNEWRSGMGDFAAAIQSRLPRTARGGR